MASQSDQISDPPEADVENGRADSRCQEPHGSRFKTLRIRAAEIPGSDKADEIVMLGGHLDSWHAATGATDNGIGSSIMIEAVRLIESQGLKPRRTIRWCYGRAKRRGCSVPWRT